jgi:hypothetical protein
MKGSRAIVVGSSLVAILAAAYFWPGPRPPVGEARVVARPIPAARTSVVATPSQATMDVEPTGSFHALQLCAYASRDLAATQELSNCKAYEGRPEYENAYAQCLNGWMDVPNRKEAAQRDLAGCGDTSDIEARYFAATRREARAGDPDAQMCYLLGQFEDLDFDEYRRVAPAYVDAAFRRGDWRIVELMTRRSFPPGSGPITQLDGIGTPETIYKMTRLLRLGASGTYARGLDSDLDGMIHPDLVPEAALPSEVVKRGDAWAQETFNEIFSGVTGLTERPTNCGPRQSLDFLLPNVTERTYVPQPGLP